MKDKTKIILSAVILVVLGICLILILNNKEAEKVCTKEYMPVCGVDGKTYGNKCMAQDVEISYEGECLIANPDAICIEIYSPVCGIDGKTYSNSCDAEQRNGMKIAFQGEC